MADAKPGVRYGLPGYFSITSDGQKFKTTAGAPNLTHGFHWRWKAERFLNFSVHNFSQVSQVFWPLSREALHQQCSLLEESKWMCMTKIQKYISVATCDVTHLGHCTCKEVTMWIHLLDLPEVLNWQHDGIHPAQLLHIHTSELHEHNDVTISNTQD